MQKTILIVDDFETTLYTVGATLKAKKFNVLKASNGQEAIKQLNGQNINLIISDYNMPEMSGLDLIEYVRSTSDYGTVPILILTTENSEEKKREALTKGATGWIKKPYQFDDFIKKVNRVIR